MSESYIKLFSTIATSTIWSEPLPTRVVWITMLAVSGRNGEVLASIPGLARLANVTLPECEAALQTLLSPDPYSRTEDHEGRRIEKIDGGWRLLNFAKYRERMSQDEKRERQRRWIAEKRAKDKSEDGQGDTAEPEPPAVECRQAASTPVDKSTKSTQAEAEAETEAKSRSKSPRADAREAAAASPPLGKGGDFAEVPIPDCIPRSAWRDWCQHRREKRQKLTQRSVDQQLAFLADRSLDGDDPAEVIAQSIRNGWTGLFPLRGANGGRAPPVNPQEFRVSKTGALLAEMNRTINRLENPDATGSDPAAMAAVGSAPRIARLGRA